MANCTAILMSPPASTTPFSDCSTCRSRPRGGACSGFKEGKALPPPCSPSNPRASARAPE
eukprot:6478262-Amphidinium_carterae.3